MDPIAAAGIFGFVYLATGLGAAMVWTTDNLGSSYQRGDRVGVSLAVALLAVIVCGMLWCADIVVHIAQGA